MIDICQNMISLSDKAVLNAIFNPLLPTEDCEDNTNCAIQNDLIKIDQATLKAQSLEVDGVKAAESGNIQRALELFSEAITVCPSRASSYNNRAQALRIDGKVEDSKVDLQKAIELSNGEGKAACQAYTQSALIARLEHREEDAKAYFEMAAKLGSTFAKTQLVMMNPYAAMCNKMLSEAFEKLKRGEAEDEEQAHTPA